MTTKFLLIIFLIVWSAIPRQLPAQTVSVPLSHWAYQAVERWEIRGFIQSSFNATRPFTRQEMGEYLSEVIRAFKTHPEKFTRTEREQLLYLQWEFREELSDSFFFLGKRNWEPRLKKVFRIPPLRHLNPYFYSNHRNLISLRHGEFALWGDPVFNINYQEFSRENGETLRQSRWSNGLLFRGHLGSHFGYYFNLTDNHVDDDRYKNLDPPPQVIEESGWPFLTTGAPGRFDFDENMASISLHFKYFYLVFGREYNQWGVGHRGNLLLSTNAQLYDQFKFVIRYWRFKFTHITASLEYISPEARQSIKSQPHVDVYWAGNRLEINLGRGWQLGLSEAVIYGNRSLQMGYLTPLSFYKSLEHYYGDRDNGLLGMDLEWRLRPGFKIFGEWLIDDITTGKLGSDFFGNKFGWQVGGFWVNILGLPDLDLLIEYTRIKPYVYTQSFQDFNKYKHYDTILGHPIGPNSDDIYLRLQKQLSKFFQISLELERYRHGSNFDDINVGGDPDLAFRYGTDQLQAPFLQGQRHKQEALGLGITYEILRNLFSEFRYAYTRYDSGETEGLLSWRFSFNFGQRPEPIPLIHPLTY
ncbi:MAG: hypothetical protein Kow0042_18980 [Calditrichia bacterium]